MKRNDMRKLIWLLPLFLVLILPSFAQAASTLNVSSPINTTYTSNPVTLTATSNASNPQFFYSLDGGANVSFVSGGTLSFTNGVHNFRVIVNDSSGHFNSTLIQFTMDATSFADVGSGSGLGGIIAPFAFAIFIIAVILFCVFLLRNVFRDAKPTVDGIAVIVIAIITVVIAFLLFASTITP